jgi:hypothetical protein
MKQKDYFYLQTLCLVSQYVCFIDINIVKHIIHIKTLIDSGAMACFVDENFGKQQYLKPL